MKPNVGAADRTVRLAVGLALLSILFVDGSAGGGEWRWVGLIGLVPIATSLLRFCPLYAALGWRTCRLNADGSCGCGH